MPRVCYFTGRHTSIGNQITTRGKAKYLGGVGTKTTGITARKFRAEHPDRPRPDRRHKSSVSRCQHQGN